MRPQVMPKSALVDWVDVLKSDYRVLGPMRQQSQTQPPAGNSQRETAGNRHVFGEILRAEELDLDYRTTILPPKKLFLPQEELLFDFKDSGRAMNLHLDDRPTVIIGLHTCDLHALLLLDQVFGQGLIDQHYLVRRANAALVTVECLEPCSENAFCKDMATWVAPEAFDLHLTDLDQEYAVEIGSERGARLVEDLAAVRSATDSDARRLDQVMSAKWPRFPYRLGTELADLPGLLALSYRSQVWEELGQQCLGCGVCTTACPTCVCFDVVDEVNFDLESGRRIRVWDSCQHGQFATVAGGHDFRRSRAARLRHRFSHKFKYQPESTGLAGCVGCGRCADACLVNIRPVEVLNRLQLKHRAAVAGKRREVTA